MKILLADDDPVSRRIMQRLLQNSGYEVSLAETGRQAVRELSNAGGPRLALIDWMMPELDGPEVCRRVRRGNVDCYVYILLLTSNESPEDIVTGLEAGADDYLTKPCHPAELKARLRTGQRILQLEDRLVESRERMRFKATHDSLTSLWNRGAILLFLRDELIESRGHAPPVSLLLCDIDHFKSINDSYGHAVGDEVLVEVSARLRVAVQKSDGVGRFGGEEFLIVLRGCPRVHLRERAEQVREAIGCRPFSTKLRSFPISLSIGAVCSENWDEGVTMESLLKMADVALYKAKTGGRDRVVFAETSTHA